MEISDDTWPAPDEQCRWSGRADFTQTYTNSSAEQPNKNNSMACRGANTNYLRTASMVDVAEKVQMTKFKRVHEMEWVQRCTGLEPSIRPDT